MFVYGSHALSSRHPWLWESSLFLGDFEIIENLYWIRDQIAYSQDIFPSKNKFIVYDKFIKQVLVTILLQLFLFLPLLVIAL